MLYVVACGAPAAADVHALVPLAQQAGWQVHVVTTLMGARFIDAEKLERLTGDVVRSTYRTPDQPKGLPPADAVIVAPATFNTINKWANGITDTFAVGLLCEVNGLRRSDSRRAATEGCIGTASRLPAQSGGTRADGCPGAL